MQITKKYNSKLILHHDISFDSLIKLFNVCMKKVSNTVLYPNGRLSTGVNLSMCIVTFFDKQWAGIIIILDFLKYTQCMQCTCKVSFKL